MASVTPMMQQYLSMKEKYKDAILFFRLGDFYEMFFDDARLVSQELELTLTGKDCGLEERAPMCGVPYHAANTYISRLIENGHRVAICEQMEDPALAKGLVTREVIRIVTPGTVMDQSMLPDKRNNFLLAIVPRGKGAGMAMCDVSTGEFSVFSVRNRESIPDELARISPTEIVLQKEETRAEIASFPASVTVFSPVGFSHKRAVDCLKKHFEVDTTEALGLSEEDAPEQDAAGLLMAYLNETQKNALEHITRINRYAGDIHMALDRSTRRNLELTEPIRGSGKKGTLLWLLDRTSTAMGGRMLRSFVEQPLKSRDEIEKRLALVEAIYNDTMLMQDLSEELRHVYDVERLLSKISYASINAKDCLSLQQSLSRVPQIRGLLLSSGGVLSSLAEGMLPMEDVSDLLLRAINEDAPLLIGDGGFIRSGFSKELDEYRLAQTDGKRWINELEAREREETGIKNLKIAYNRIFGYCIEITKSNYDQVPLRYQRRQTLTNCERYTTDELREIERKITGAQDMAVKLELQLFAQIRDMLKARIADFQQTAERLKTLDALLSFAKVARENDYVKPEMNDKGVLIIENGRHPVVEAVLGRENFVPNDTEMDEGAHRMQIITGPNMAGKSTYMRQVALIALMAHIGCFVPATRAEIPVVDRIFTRVGASDDLAAGQSTFMVEMAEMANILRSATKDSLVVLDEIGRGTSTFDGLSIAWAVVEYLCDKDKIGAKTLFATHYHELSELEGKLEGVCNYRSAVKEHGEEIIFLRRILPGGADKSFGVHVARLAGMPKPVLRRAQEILARLEVNQIKTRSIGESILEEEYKKPKQVDMFSVGQNELVDELRRLDVNSLTPMEALNQLYLLREKARKI
ncbi:MAG: DNA mismatch repair protein MutS [Eubacteriales bacterium]|nr:DNA mismatch repair protein MutS [Eubacteriales bacterium]MDD4513300.1 DNA mismatch repair protein MutS [Eubacteriales bacterium]